MAGIVGIKSVFTGGIGRSQNQDAASAQYSVSAPQNANTYLNERDRNRGGVLESLTSLKSNNYSDVTSMKMGSVQKPIKEGSSGS